MSGSRVARPGASEGRVRVSPLEAHLRLLLASGGDERLWLDPVTRRNRYGVPAAPAPDELWFSSSTACAVSPRGWAAAAEALERLTGAAALPIDRWFDDLRARLLALYGAPGAEAILCASGTEAELLALTLARSLSAGRGLGPIVNVVVAPAETGSGVPAAAAARHFLGRASLGGPVAKGERLTGWDDGAIAIEMVEIRRPDGRLRRAADVDQEAATAVQRAVEAGAFAILHVLDASKTGRSGVSRAVAARILARHAGRVLVVVDACQLRCGAEAIRADLGAGFAVMITGSKFAGGPAFSGALLAPASLVERLRETGLDASPLAAYSAAFDWPAALRERFQHPLPHAANLGLGLRWSAALAEIEAFTAIDPAFRAALLAEFDRGVRERVAADPGLRLLDGEGGAPGLAPNAHLDGVDARAVYEALQRGDAGRACHLGQPVAVGEQLALRACASMPMITAAASDGLARLEADLDAAFAAWATVRQPVATGPVARRSGPERASLDPDDWAAFRAEAHAALDAAVDRLANVGRGPVWRATPSEVRGRFDAALPRAPRPLGEVLADVDTLVAPYVVGNTHPRFFGWAHGAGTPIGVVAELIAAGLDANCGGRDHIGPIVERQVARWAAEAFGFPADSSGLFVTGTSQANFLAALVARDAARGHAVRRDGLRAAGQLCAYASAEAHACVPQALELAGIGGAHLRRIETDWIGAMRCDALRAAIAADRAAGRTPFLIVGTAGGVNFGAFDDLDVLADIAAAERVWLHVDGAFGALTALSAELRPLTEGLGRAHSVGFDFHKWAHVPYDAGFLLVRDGAAHKQTFAAPAAYLSRAPRGLAAGGDWPCDYGPDLSRGFRALKVWMTFQTLGADAIAAAMDANCAAAQRLADHVRGSALFELAAPVPLNIVCFSLRADRSGAANRELVMRLQEQGLAAPSTTRLGDREVVRAAVFNHRTTADDIDHFFADAERIGAQVLAG